MDKIFAIENLLGVFRAALAWLFATFVGAACGTALMVNIPTLGLSEPTLGGAFTTFMLVWLLGGILSAPFAVAIVWAIRLFGLPRPWSEVSAGALVAGVMPALLFVLIGPYMARLVLPMLSATLPAGAVAGGAYWVIAGRPGQALGILARA